MTNEEARGPHPMRKRHPDQCGQPAFSIELELTLHRAFSLASQRDHEYATLEHLLLALIDDAVASALMKDCKVDVSALKANVATHIDNELKTQAVNDDRDPAPTPALQRVVQQAALHVQELGGEVVTGADLILAILEQTESPAVRLLAEQGVTRQHAADFVFNLDHRGMLKHPVQPEVVRRPNRRGRGRWQSPARKPSRGI